MHPYSFPPVDAELPSLLGRLREQFAAGDDAGAQSTLAEIGPRRAGEPATLAGALCIGGVDFATALAASLPDGLDADACTALVLDAFASVIEAPPQAPADHERRVAQWLIDAFALTADAASLLDAVRAEFLIDRGPLEELPQAIGSAMRLQLWTLSLRGIERVKQSLGQATPRQTQGLGAVCLHQLGRYAEADQWVHEGLNAEERQWLQIPPVHTEEALLRRWGRGRAPVVSIICTTYNHERYIENTIRGFLSQDCAYPFEILIHDDASTDRTQDVIRAWQQRYPNIIKPVLQVENQKSQGVRPFELLLAQARGDYVATCEGDDYWIDRGKLQKQVSFLAAHPDVSCSAHNYYHFIETSVTVRPWSRIGRDIFLSQRQLMATQFLLWLPTLVFRKTFSALPPERALAAFGDQFLTSYLGTLGRCAYFDTFMGAVRRENEFSSWSPLPEGEKERRRVKTWVAMLRMHERLGQSQAVDDLNTKIHASKLDARTKAALFDASANSPTSSTFAAA
jgi:glycosyltransferase involved in cell wall biosynthesis